MNRFAARMILLVLLVVAGVFLAGINWGLPSREADKYLLGADHHGLRLEGLTGKVPEVDPNRGADVVDPSGAADQVVELNDTDLKKAQILCRYRLYSYQPDEMITFRSLSRMKPRAGDLDPRLYQYGGLWIYGVGAIVEVGNALGLLQVTSRDLYIGHPEIFGRFYVAARGYSVAFGFVGVWAIFQIARRVTGNPWLAAAGALAFALMPVVVNSAHEAKPHLAGCVLILLAVLAADEFVRTGKMKWAWGAGVLCGAATGMVLWGVVGMMVIPVMAVMNARECKQKWRVVVFATVAALGVYAVTNPYVIYHLVRDPAVLRSNLGNTSAMYHWTRPDLTAWNALQLAVAGTGPGVFFVGLWGIIAAIRRGMTAMEVLLAAVGVTMLIPFVAMAGGKPGEYARFAIVPDAALVVFAVGWMGRMKWAWMRRTAAIGVVAATACYGLPYDWGFMVDAKWTKEAPSRVEAADNLSLALSVLGRHPGDRLTLCVYADPAPYCLPPLDLSLWRIVRVPRNYDLHDGAIKVDAVVRVYEPLTVWIPGSTPMSWANKKFDLVW